tara:strand:- start:856 stop:1107 length:252 start_codon:yes stop_codon:yes gene_type:complete
MFSYVHKLGVNDVLHKFFCIFIFYFLYFFIFFLQKNLLFFSVIDDVTIFSVIMSNIIDLVQVDLCRISAPNRSKVGILQTKAL